MSAFGWELPLDIKATKVGFGPFVSVHTMGGNQNFAAIFTNVG